MITYEEISNDSVSSHHGIVRYIACLKDNERHLVKFRENPDFVSRTVLRKKASINYFVNVGNKVSFHFEKRWIEKYFCVQKSCQLRIKDN
jgi:hypothetical protein